MAVFKCKMCGGNIEFNPGDSIGVCDSCGTTQTLPKASDDAISSLYNRANTLRIKSEFDRAEEMYNKIITADETQAEAYWGIILCKYGIEYVEDPKTFKRVPTCHRASFDSVSADSDFKLALKYGDAEQKKIYRAEAKAIDSIQKDILKIANNEKPFDVFLCYKETDDSGKRTQDSVIANDIYHQLIQEGFKVFYAAITLEDKLGQEYEPYIFAALNSAKVMLVIGSKPEYFTAVWVKNEWSRFLKLMKNDRSKLLIPCYKDMDAYELPDEFAHLQAQDMSKIGFINDVVRGIKKVATKDSEPAVISVPVAAESDNSITPLLKRAFMFLEDGSFDEADEYCERVLDKDPENAEAYLGKLMAELKVRKQEDLKNCGKAFDISSNYQKAVRFGDDSFAEQLKADNEENQKYIIYQDALKAMKTASDESSLRQAALKLKPIAGYKDSDKLREQCLEKAEAFRKDEIYKSAKNKMTDHKTEEYEKAIKLFESIPGWKDSDKQVSLCQQKIEEIKAKEEADRLEAERKAKQAWIAKKKAKQKTKKLLKIAIPAVAVLIVFIFVLNTVIIPASKYNKAVNLSKKGEYEEAYSVFRELGRYKDSRDKMKTILKTYKKVGETVFFGSYEQDNNPSNGKEEIEWIILAKENNSALLISKYALDCQQYNISDTDVTWETCSLREWLNETFLSVAFCSEEQNSIISSTVTADKNPEHNTSPGNNTTDKVFLLSITEANQYFRSDEARKCAATDYANAQGVWTSDNYSADGKAICWWWLRSSVEDSDGFAIYAAGVNIEGSVITDGNLVSNDENAVRPAMWIKVN